MSFRSRYCSSTEHKLIRVSQSLRRNPGRRHPHLPCFYPHSKWATSWAAVHVGVRFKAQVHHHRDGPGLLGSCYLKSGLLDRAITRSLPNKAVDVIADKLSGDRLILASSTHGSWTRLPFVISVSVYAACCTVALEET